MYLARKITPGGVHYTMRHTYLDGEVYRFKNVFDLGTAPENYINYSGDVHFEIDETVVLALTEHGVNFVDNELEELFFPFLDPYIRFKIEPFRNRHNYRSWKPMSGELRKRAIAHTHVFDRRRIHFLRFGHCSSNTLDKSPPLYKILLEKSRDEIEQLIFLREQDLQARELFTYLFSIFDLGRFFREQYARSHPFVLAREKVDTFFLQEFCALDQDSSFWAGFERSERVPEYLKRYLFLYFDHADNSDLMYHNMGQRFRRARRRYRPYHAEKKMSVSEAARVFGLSQQELAQLSRKELTTLYRKKAHTMHPDKGGDSDTFIKFTDAYKELLKSRPKV
ncbi:MAG: hypothetical protein CSA31_01205 [Desulfobulbus propionicus]|nr:MAG: hypothetical protein CSB34_06335 [Desulfobulbus propionicus]PIE60604.1 MAG: hypothetical protein CSA31_01205 [Desulfobulbus propionicus]